jgi:hypothetical protein
MKLSSPLFPKFFLSMRIILIVVATIFMFISAIAVESDPAHRETNSETPVAWPGGVIPYDISKLSERQQKLALKAMQRWMDTGANLRFVPRTNEIEYVNFTGHTKAGNNTSLVGFKKNVRTDINITTFWWGDEWMPVHELGHALGFFHEHARWDRDRLVTVHYENIKPGRAADYDWIPQTNWLVRSTAYDFHSIMHYRVCWASNCGEPPCRDADGSSPCAVISPLDKKFDAVIGQWGDNGISATDAEKARLVYGTKQPPKSQ